MNRKAKAPEPQKVVWPRADRAELERFDPRTKVCTMNCGPSSDDPRRSAERKLLCGDCLPASADARTPIA